MEEGSCGRAEVQATVRALIFPIRSASLALGVNPVDLGAVTRETANALRPALFYEVIEGLIFGCEGF